MSPVVVWTVLPSSLGVGDAPLNPHLWPHDWLTLLVDVTISWFETELRGDFIVVAERCRSCVEVRRDGVSILLFPKSLFGVDADPRLEREVSRSQLERASLFLLLGETQATFMFDFSSSSCARLYSLTVCEATNLDSQHAVVRV